MKLEARLMTISRDRLDDIQIEETGGYMPLEKYEILNADETLKAVISTINYNARMYQVMDHENRMLAEEIKVLKKLPDTKWKAFKFLFK